MERSAEQIKQEQFELEEHPIDAAVSLNVVVVGSGITGITAGILLPRKLPNIKLRILERHSEVGGVWHANTYPGVRCDVPSDVYQTSFAPKTTWTHNYAEGHEIKDYWKSLVQRYDVAKYIEFDTTVTQAQWSQTKAKWIISVKSMGSTVHRTIEAHFLVTATGLFSNPTLPDIENLHLYEGHLRHSSQWDHHFDFAMKNVAVIGNGASGLQVVPALQKCVSQLDHYCRSKTWIAESFGGETLSRSSREIPPQYAEGYTRYRKNLEKNFFRIFGTIFKDSDRNKAAKVRFEARLTAKLGKRSDLLKSLAPDFAPGCRRLTPGPGYLEALLEPNVHHIIVPIKRFTRTGMELVDGTLKEYDAVICCTGSDLSYVPTFPIIANGIDLKAAWAPNGQPGYPETYLGMAAPNFPNLFFLLGPNSAGPGGTVPNVIENQVTYLAKILRKVALQGIRSLQPSQAATNDFQAVCESFWPRTVLTEGCRSWYNGGIPGGRITAMWPGSATHANIARREVRFEDSEYTYHSESGNRFAWLGNGFSTRDVSANSPADDATVNYTPHLSEEAVTGKIDLRNLHESWYGV